MLDEFGLGEILAGIWNLLLLGGGVLAWAIVLGRQGFPLRQAGPPPRWNLSLPDLFFVLGMGLMIYAMVMLILMEVPQWFTRESVDEGTNGEAAPGGEGWSFFFSAVAFQSGILLGIVLLVRFYPQVFQTVRESPTPPLSRREAAAWGALGLLLAFPLVVVSSLIWHFVLRTWGYEIAFQEVVSRLLEIENPILFILTLLSVAILAPVWEEIIFRAGLFRLLHNRLSFWGAAVLSGAIFAAVHASLPQFAALWVLGIVLAFVYQRTGSLLAVICLHGFFNLNTIWLIFLMRWVGTGES